MSIITSALELLFGTKVVSWKKYVWMNSMNQKSPIFMHWDLILRYETLADSDICLCSQKKNFLLYVEV